MNQRFRSVSLDTVVLPVAYVLDTVTDRQVGDLCLPSEAQQTAERLNQEGAEGLPIVPSGRPEPAPEEEAASLACPHGYVDDCPECHEALSE
jgi:hypothetical protein